MRRGDPIERVDHLERELRFRDYVITRLLDVIETYEETNARMFGLNLEHGMARELVEEALAA